MYADGFVYYGSNRSSVSGAGRGAGGPVERHRLGRAPAFDSGRAAKGQGGGNRSSDARPSQARPLPDCGAGPRLRGRDGDSRWSQSRRRSGRRSNAMRCRRAHLFKSRLRIHEPKESTRNEVVVTGRGSVWCFFPCIGEAQTEFRAELVHPSLRSEAGSAGEFSEFGADFRSDARGPTCIFRWQMQSRWRWRTTWISRWSDISRASRGTDITRAEGGGLLRGLSLLVDEPPPGIGGPSGPLLTTLTASSTPAPVVNSNFSDVALITEQQNDLSVTGAMPLRPAARRFRNTIPPFRDWSTGRIKAQPEYNPLITGASNWLVSNNFNGNVGIHSRLFARHAARRDVRQYPTNVQRGALHLQSDSELKPGIYHYPAAAARLRNRVESPIHSHRQERRKDRRSGVSTAGDRHGGRHRQALYGPGESE